MGLVGVWGLPVHSLGLWDILFACEAASEALKLPRRDVLRRSTPLAERRSIIAVLVPLGLQVREGHLALLV